MYIRYALFAALLGSSSCSVSNKASNSPFDKFESQIQTREADLGRFERGTTPERALTTSPSSSIPDSSYEVEFHHCGMIRYTCVVDGDTFWFKGTKIRIADIDTPEVSQPRCPAEKALGDRATNRFIELLNEGPFEIASAGNRDTDRYGRALRIVLRNGHSLGDQLVQEGLARTWKGRREPWC